jgi:hypothetical protein
MKQIRLVLSIWKRLIIYTCLLCERNHYLSHEVLTHQSTAHANAHRNDKHVTKKHMHSWNYHPLMLMYPYALIGSLFF